MNTIRFTLYMIGIIIFLVVLLLLIFTVKDYNPEKIKIIKQSKAPDLIKKDTIEILNWNIGYCGLSEDMSFFYDGGTKVRTSKQQTKQNLKAIKNHLQNQDGIDFILLQEVDQASKRSYYINEYTAFKKGMSSYHSYFSFNYKVPFVLVPISKPLGKVESGLATFSKNRPSKVTRHQFPGKYPWPKNLFMLDRCFMTCRHPLPNGKDLLIINTHNSAYDNGELKKKEMEALRKFIVKEYDKGNYIITGGDWNQYPPNIKENTGVEEKLDLTKTGVISEGYIPKDWTWAYDPKTATNRALNKPLNENTAKTIIDFFLMSPNIELINVETENLNFKYSDHQPVYLKVKLML